MNAKVLPVIGSEAHNFLNENMHELRNSHKGQYILLLSDEMFQVYETLNEALQGGYDMFGTQNFHVEHIL